jgi:protein tyrosine phosphatase
MLIPPSWIEHANSKSHIDNVLTSLARREQARVNARKASRRKPTHPYPPANTKLPLSYYYSVSVGARADHHTENRYMDIEPYDRTRVVFNSAGAEDAPRYLNANWVRELAGGKWWIATQAPLPNTVRTFLDVLLRPIPCPRSTVYDPSSEQSTSNPLLSSSRRVRVRTVVQLTRYVENGTRKADIYIPARVGESYVIPGHDGMPPLRITLLKTRRMDNAGCVISQVSLTQLVDGQRALDPVVFNHLLYASWPDHGVPEEQDRASLVQFISLVHQINRQGFQQPFDDPDPPIMVNCSAGVGRTGAFIVLSSLLRAHGLLPPTQAPVSSLPPSPLGPLPADIVDDPVAQEVDSCREQRPGMVQRDEQILLIYDILTEMLSMRRRV